MDINDRIPHTDEEAPVAVIERLGEITRGAIFANKRMGGAALFYLPDNDDEVHGSPVIIRSREFKAWLSKRYRIRYGFPPANEAIEGFVRSAYINSFLQGHTVKK